MQGSTRPFVNVPVSTLHAGDTIGVHSARRTEPVPKRIKRMAIDTNTVTITVDGMPPIILPRTSQVSARLSH